MVLTFHMINRIRDEKTGKKVFGVKDRKFQNHQNMSTASIA